MKLFDVDGPLYQFMSGLTNLFIVNMCFLLTSIPIVTIGASLAALSDVTLRMAEEREGYIAKQYFKAFKSNFKQGLIMGILLLICAYVIYLYFELFNKIPDASIFLLIMAIVSVFIFVFSFIYAFLLLARYTNTVPNYLRNSFRISMKFIGRTVLVLFLVALEVIVFLWNTFFWFIGLIIGPAFISVTVAYIAKDIFKKLEYEREDR